MWTGWRPRGNWLDVPFADAIYNVVGMAHKYMRTNSRDDGNCSLLFSSSVCSCCGSLVCRFDAIYTRVVFVCTNGIENRIFNMDAAALHSYLVLPPSPRTTPTRQHRLFFHFVSRYSASATYAAAAKRLMNTAERQQMVWIFFSFVLDLRVTAHKRRPKADTKRNRNTTDRPTDRASVKTECRRRCGCME